MKPDRKFLNQVNLMWLLDRLFALVTPIFCALVIIGAFFHILWRK